MTQAASPATEASGWSGTVFGVGVTSCALLPKPTRTIPIWLGGSSEAAFERAARVADGFIFFGGGIERTVDAWEQLRERVRSLGRSVDDFGADWIAVPDGGIDTVTADIDAWREAGGTHISLLTMGLGFDSAEAHIEYLTAVADALSLS